MQAAGEVGSFMPLGATHPPVLYLRVILSHRRRINLVSQSHHIASQSNRTCLYHTPCPARLEHIHVLVSIRRAKGSSQLCMKNMTGRTLVILGSLKYRANCGESRSLQSPVSILIIYILQYLRLAIPCKTDLIDENFFGQWEWTGSAMLSQSHL